MPRSLAFTLIIAAIISAAFFIVGRAGSEKDRAPEKSGIRGVSSTEGIERQDHGTGETEYVESVSEAERECPHEKSAVRKNSGIRIGSFERPHSVPGYEIVQRSPDERDGACGTHLLVDTRARSEADLALITRDIKARYSIYDAVSIEFTDTTVTLDYNGGALIFNTPDGAYYIGFIYGPPNNKGFIARAAE